jgi:predicted transposase/invertase (TIGR01784 family)
MFDNLSKFLAQQYPEDFASWLVGSPIAFTELKPTELSLELIRADSVILLQSAGVILHGEFQTDPDVDMGFRMADYALRIFRKYPDRRLIQVVVYLRQTDSSAVYETTFRGNNLVHEFRVIRLWEQPTEPFLQSPGLWPYAALTQNDDREGVLREVARKIEMLTDRREQGNLAAISAVIGGLSLEKQLVGRILRRDLMQESVIYQEWRQEIEQEVSQKERLEERRSLALKMLQEGATLEFVTKVTDLTTEQIQQLQAENA